MPDADLPDADLLTRLAEPDAPPFALLHRPHAGPEEVDLLLGETAVVARIADLPAGPGDGDLLAVLPFRQLRERGFEAVDDGEPLLALRVRHRRRLPLATLLRLLPAGPDGFVETGYDVPDAEYEASVAAVLTDEIARGEGSNVVLQRCLTGRVPGPVPRALLGVLRRLLLGERDAYWTFAVHLGVTSFVGASPERHVAVDGGTVLMHPISGTLRHPSGGWAGREERVRAVLGFLDDRKEEEELAMVLDEELKLMAAVDDRGARVEGPVLHEMSHLTHTAFRLVGDTSLDVREVLAATMFAPTVTGSPLRNACRIIARHERRGRGYYAGVLALIDRDPGGARRLDAPILIRTARIDPAGGVRVAAGATLVRGSRPAAELAETRAKAAGVLSALHGEPRPGGSVAGPVAEEVAEAVAGPVADDPRVRAALAARAERLAGFWREPRPTATAASAPASGRRSRRVLVVDAEDDFTAMLAHLLRSLGTRVEVVPWHQACGARVASDVVVLGPGPGDPRDTADPRITALRRIAVARVAARRPTLAVCLGHQVVCGALGLPLHRLDVPDQGTQRRVEVFGRARTVGFYNSYVAVAAAAADGPGRSAAAGLAPGGSAVELSRDPASGRVHALRRAGLVSLQFHPESVLTADGVTIVAEALATLTGRP